LPTDSNLRENSSAAAVAGDGEGPVRRVLLGAYAIAPATVANRAFSDFVQAKRFITDAEQSGSSFVSYLQVPTGSPGGPAVL